LPSIRAPPKSPATASEHLTVLREGGLVSSRRLGRRMVHTRSALGEALLEPFGR